MKNNYWGERASEVREEALKIAEGAAQRIHKAYSRAAKDSLKEFAQLLRPYKMKDGDYDIQAIKRAYRTDRTFRFKYQRFLKKRQTTKKNMLKCGLNYYVVEKFLIQLLI